MFLKGVIKLGLNQVKFKEKKIADLTIVRAPATQDTGSQRSLNELEFPGKPAILSGIREEKTIQRFSVRESRQTFQ